MSVIDVPDAELVRRVVEGQRVQPRSSRGRTVPMWSKVSDRFCLGSTYSKQLCERFGFDPDEQVRP
ncbi:hypothetical protein [Sphingomonas sp.]|uniref:hypothetical protein n=1 Tax=Sphingomonas sp. TaxID=28214 RepID=UPI0025E78933|nr:hypothetical protein [Sphingomonas sp.]